jgi:hypothetical protein
MHCVLGKSGIFIVLLAGMAMSETPAATKAVPARPARRPAGDPAAAVDATPRAIPRMWPEQLPAQPPRVSYQNGQLTLDSQNSTLGDILTAIRRLTGAQFEIPAGVGSERVASHLSGSPRDVITSLLDGSNVGFIVLGPPDNPSQVQKVILTVLPKDAGTAPAAAQVRPAPVPPPPPEEEPEPEPPIAPLPTPPPQPVTPRQRGGMPPIPGAVPNPNLSADQQPGVTTVPGAPAGSNQSQTPKTPEQLLQDLQRMRQQNQNQNPPQQ